MYWLIYFREGKKNLHALLGKAERLSGTLSVNTASGYSTKRRADHFKFGGFAPEPIWLK
jgi:hypothetical protein